MSSDIIQSNEFGRVEKTVFSDKNSLTTTEGLLIKHQYCQASLSLYGGHVLTWQPKEQQPVFWMSKDSLFGDGKGIRGGIPLCFPWFGGYESDLFQHNKDKELTDAEHALIPNHGFARTTLWQVDDVEITEEFVKVILIQQGENQSPVWNIPYELKQVLVFGESFSQEFIIVNKSTVDVEYTGALHSYFAVGDPKNTHINQLSDVEYFDKLSGTYNNISILNNCEGPIDRVYESNRVINIIDKDWDRIIEVSSSDCHQWVLWNPGKETAQSMADVHKSGENEYVCLEAANTKPIAISAGAKVSFAQKVVIRSL